MKTLATEGWRNRQRSFRGWLEVQRGQSGTGYPFTPSLLGLLPVGAEATGPPDSGLPPPRPAQPSPVGPRRRRAGALAAARALPSPNPGPARQGGTPSPLSARSSFQDELSARSSEPSPGRVALPQRDAGAPPGLPGGAAGAKAEEAPSQIRPAARTGRRERAPPRPTSRAPADPELERACPSPRPPPRARPDTPARTPLAPPRTAHPDAQLTRPAPRPAPLSARLRPAPAPAPGPACARASGAPGRKSFVREPRPGAAPARQAGTTSSAPRSSRRRVRSGNRAKGGMGSLWTGRPRRETGTLLREARSRPAGEGQSHQVRAEGGRAVPPRASPPAHPTLVRAQGPARPRRSQTSPHPHPHPDAPGGRSRPAAAGSPPPPPLPFVGRRVLRETLVPVSRRNPRPRPGSGLCCAALPGPLRTPFPGLSSGF